MTNTHTTNGNNSNRPTHTAYQVRERADGQKSFWTRIGTVWTHADGNGFNIQLECTPLDGRITLRTFSDTSDKPEQ